VKAQLDANAATRREIEAGLSELDAAAVMTLYEYEREMDAFVAALQAERA
jgi:hypothetical protein